jgi:hypothetical protein
LEEFAISLGRDSYVRLKLRQFHIGERKGKLRNDLEQTLQMKIRDLHQQILECSRKDSLSNKQSLVNLFGICTQNVPEPAFPSIYEAQLQMDYRSTCERETEKLYRVAQKDILVILAMANIS